MNTEGFNMKITGTLVKKEMLDVLRDRKTVLMMLVVPLVLYPLIYIGVMQVMVFISSNMEKQNYRIVVEADDEGALLNKLAETGQQKEAGENDAKAYELTVVDADSIADYETALNGEEIDAYISGRMQDGKMRYAVYYLSSETNSAYAADLAMDILDELRADLTRQKLLDEGLDVQAVLEPVDYGKEDIASSEQSLGSIMGSILPFMLVISLLIGTMYPAIDTTAGERERGTLETILTLPVTNR